MKISFANSSRFLEASFSFTDLDEDAKKPPILRPKSRSLLDFLCALSGQGGTMDQFPCFVLRMIVLEVLFLKKRTGSSLCHDFIHLNFLTLHSLSQIRTETRTLKNL